MTSLYQSVFAFFNVIMASNAEAAMACELVSICVTVALTYFILLTPLRLVLDVILRRKKKK